MKYDAEKTGPAQKAELSWDMQKVHGALQFLKYGRVVKTSEKQAPLRAKGSSKLIDILSDEE